MAKRTVAGARQSGRRATGRDVRRRDCQATNQPASPGMGVQGDLSQWGLYVLCAWRGAATTRYRVYARRSALLGLPRPLQLEWHVVKWNELSEHRRMEQARHSSTTGRVLYLWLFCL